MFISDAPKGQPRPKSKTSKNEDASEPSSVPTSSMDAVNRSLLAEKNFRI